MRPIFISRATSEIPPCLFLQKTTPADPRRRLHDAYAVTAEFISDIIRETCRRFPGRNQNGKTARVERLIQSDAWMTRRWR